MNRLKEIAKKKEEMKGEGEKLSEERKKLDEEIKKKAAHYRFVKRESLSRKYRNSTIRLKNLMRN